MGLLIFSNSVFQVTLKCGSQSDDSCMKRSSTPSSVEYNVREPINICDVLPPPPDHPYYKTHNTVSMTIRTNPMSPQMCHRQTTNQQRWPTLASPIPHFSQNWQDKNDESLKCNRNISPDIEEENDYESGSVLYEECDQNLGKNFFNYGGEPTEEYYRNINMECLNSEIELEPPPDPCPDTLPRNRTMQSVSGYLSQSWRSKSHSPSISNELTSSNDKDCRKPQNNQSPVNNRRSGHNPNCESNQSTDSSDESGGHNKRRQRSRSKSIDRKFRNLR